MSSPRHFLVDLIKHKTLDQQHTSKAISLLAITPSPSQWYQFANYLLLIVGSLALACSVVFFIAYNWAEMGRFAKFAMVQLCILASLTWYWFAANDHRQHADQWLNSNGASELALVISAILLGVLLAVYGQTYQTGADPWQLFFSWTLMIIPWALCAKSTVLWLLVILLANTCASLYAEQALRSAGLWPNVLLLATTLLLWEAAIRRYSWLNATWAPRIIAALLCFCFTIAMLPKLFGVNETVLAWSAWGAWLLIMYVAYRKLRPDLLILTFWCLSIIVVFTAWAIYGLFKARFDFENLLIIALLLVVQGALASLWLKRCYKEFER